MAIIRFALASFIPIYFAVVGLQLDLRHGFSLLLFVGYLGYACAVEAISVYAGTRLDGQRPATALNLAVATNARGGPGIVLASITYGAVIINQSFYAVLVLLAIATSLLAGSWARPGSAPPAARRAAASVRPSNRAERCANRRRSVETARAIASSPGQPWTVNSMHDREPGVQRG